MDVFTSPYYVRSNSFLRLSGLWPYQSSAVQIRNQILVLFTIFSLYLPLCIETYVFRNNFEYFAQSIPIIVDYTVVLTKNVFFFMEGNKIKRVLDSVRQDFQICTKDELEVLHRYSKTARLFNNLYAASIFIATVTFSVQPIILTFMDMLMPLNETRLQGKLRITSYHIGEFTNNNLFITIHIFLVDIVVTFLIIGIDTVYMSLTYHACAVFFIVTKRLRSTIESDVKLAINRLEQKQDSLQADFIKTTGMHQYALKFAETMELAFSSINLIAIGCIVVTLAIVGFQVILNKDNPTLLMAYFFYVSSELTFLFYYNWPGEIVKEHSLLIHRTCYDSSWYEKEFPIKCKKMMNLMMIRSQRPSIMTAGKILVLGLENFAAVVKVSMSYLAVLSSIT